MNAIELEKVRPIFRMLGFKPKLSDKEMILYDLKNNEVGKTKTSDEMVFRIGGDELSYRHEVVTANGGYQMSTNMLSLSNAISKGKSISVIIGEEKMGDKVSPWAYFSVADPGNDLFVSFETTDDFLSTTLSQRNETNKFAFQSLDYRLYASNPNEDTNYFRYSEKVSNKEKSINLSSCSDNPEKVKLIVTTTNNGNSVMEKRYFDACHLEGLKEKLLRYSRPELLFKYVLANLEHNFKGIEEYLSLRFEPVAKATQTVAISNLDSDTDVLVGTFIQDCHLSSANIPFLDSEVKHGSKVLK